MAGAKFQYDESGGTFFYFLLSFLALVVIPCTYYFWPKDDSNGDDKKGRKCRCPDCMEKSRRLRCHEPWRRTKRNAVRAVLLLGWLAVFATAYKVAHLEHDYVKWDPFEILGIEPTASEREIRRAYHKLSLVFHPDKDTGDEQKFMMIAKAYAALTDEESRKNWETYGNPDGPGATTFGIALPSWIVEKENSLWVLGLYALVFMVALPVAVGVWWYRSAKYGEDQVLLDTSHLYLYFINKCQTMSLRRVLMIVAASLEYERGHNPEVKQRPSDDIQVPALIKALPNFSEKNKERPLCYEYSLKARALLHAHLLRMSLSPALDEDRQCVVRRCPALLAEFVNCGAQLTMLGFAGRIARVPKLETLEAAMRLSALVVQARPEHCSPLLQLPHVGEELIKPMARKGVRGPQGLATLSDRRALFRNLSDAQYQDVLHCLECMPRLQLDVRTEVLDDENEGVITAESIVTVTATLTRLPLLDPNNVDTSSLNNTVTVVAPEPTLAEPPKAKSWEKPVKKRKGGKGTKSGKGGGKRPVVHQNKASQNVPPVQEAEESNSEDSDTVEEVHDTHEDEDDDWQDVQRKVAKKDKSLEKKSKKSHSVHCPLFPDDKQEYWWVYLVEKRRHSLATVPYLVTSLVDKEEVLLKFTAPSKPGVYNYTLHVRSDSYLDLDVSQPLKLDVKPPLPQAAPPQWDISDDEADHAELEDSAAEDSDLADSSDHDA
ncbi:translocation protein SEC63 homolog [Ornithodoros turicata]|uniref:translocation protein SEC63 homolog n=1 Tax=Ornithodoros turicata TaxID=34597 RepID=UPI003138ACA8